MQNETNVPDVIQGNRALWDELTPIHLDSPFYDVSGFIAGRTSLRPIELHEMGDVRGSTLLHLQCHFGLDTLSWARRGANATGVDLSPVAIERARSLANELGIQADFHCASLDELKDVEGRTFDVVYTSYGALAWLPDIDKWADVVSRFTRPGGTFYMVEFHPVIEPFAASKRLVIESPYLYDSNPAEWKIDGTYARPGAGVSNRSYQWRHTVGDVVSALVNVGIVIDFLHEHPDVHEQMRPWMIAGRDGRYRAPNHGLPVLYSVKGHKPEGSDQQAPIGSGALR